MAVALFAVGFPAAEVLLEKWGALALIALRNSLGFVFLLVLWPLFDSWTTIRQAPWVKGVFIGTVGFGSGSTLLLITQVLTNAVTAALVVASMPVAAVALEVILDGRRLTHSFLFGLLLVVIGGVLATGVSLTDARFGFGALLGVFATALFAWGSRATVKNLKGVSQYTQVVVTTAGMAVFAMLAFLSMAFFQSTLTQTSHLQSHEIGLLLVYAWLALAISQSLWIVAVGKLGIGVASFHLNAAPFYVMLIVLLMGGKWDWIQALGAVTLAIGVVLAQKNPVINRR